MLRAKEAGQPYDAQVGGRARKRDRWDGLRLRPGRLHLTIAQLKFQTLVEGARLASQSLVGP